MKKQEQMVKLHCLLQMSMEELNESEIQLKQNRRMEYVHFSLPDSFMFDLATEDSILFHKNTQITR